MNKQMDLHKDISVLFDKTVEDILEYSAKKINTLNEINMMKKYDEQNNMLCDLITLENRINDIDVGQLDTHHEYTRMIEEQNRLMAHIIELQPDKSILKVLQLRVNELETIIINKKNEKFPQRKIRMLLLDYSTEMKKLRTEQKTIILKMAYDEYNM